MKAFLILENGTVFTGTAIGARREVISEIVFNTSMTGYLEVLTDPSYAGQAVVMTYPLIGNYGVCRTDMESDRCWLDAYIVRELARLPSNFRTETTLEAFLMEWGIPGIAGINTRMLTKMLRQNGTMNGLLTTCENYDLAEIVPKLKQYRVTGVVKRATCLHKMRYKTSHVRMADRTPMSPKNSLTENETRYHVALLDFGAKRNIADSLIRRGCDVTIYPAETHAEEIVSAQPDGILLSNGPGNPSECIGIIQELKKLFASDLPIFGICLGHQLMALACGGRTEKMKYGHRGMNHPVKDLATGRVYLSSQNHGYMVVDGSVPAEVAQTSFINVNDGTVEGLRYYNKKIFTVQFHPEACAGPLDTSYLFDEFIQMMGGK